MTTFSVDLIPHGEWRRVRIYADGNAIGMALATPDQAIALAARLAATPALPCMVCGQPVPTGEVKHGNGCLPRVCQFCTRCGKPLTTTERVAEVRVCGACITPPPWIGGLPILNNLEPDVTEGPDAIPAAPAADLLGPPSFVPEQRQGGED